MAASANYVTGPGMPAYRVRPLPDDATTEKEQNVTVANHSGKRKKLFINNYSNSEENDGENCNIQLHIIDTISILHVSPLVRACGSYILLY